MRFARWLWVPAVTGVFLVAFSGLGEDAVPDYKDIVHMGHPKDGGTSVEPGRVRNVFTGDFEPYWREVSYHKSDPTNGVSDWGYYPDTKTYGYADLPWPANPTGPRADSYVRVWDPSVHPFYTTGPVSYGGEHNWEIRPDGEPGIRHSANVPGAAPLVDGFWTPGERFFDRNNNNQWDPVLYDEPFYRNIFPKITVNGVTCFTWLTNRWDENLILPGYRDNLRGLSITNLPGGDIAGIITPGELFADYSSIERDAIPAFNSNVVIYIAETNNGVYTNVVFHINELDLSPDLYSLDSNEGDLEHFFQVDAGGTSPNANTNIPDGLYDIPTNGVLDFFNGAQQAYYERCFRYGNTNDPVSVTYQAWVFNPNHPEPPDYLDFYKPSYGNNCKDPTQIPYGTVDDWRLIWIEVPVYQASELLGLFVGWAGEARMYMEMPPADYPPNHANRRSDWWDMGYAEEPYEDFISWYMPFFHQMLPQWPGEWLHGISDRDWQAPLRVDFPPEAMNVIPYADYEAYIRNNYPGDVDALLARSGNGRYDGPDDWMDTIDNKMIIPNYVAGLTTPKPGTFNGPAYWDPMGLGMNWSAWWSTAFGSAAPGQFATLPGGWWQAAPDAPFGIIPNCVPFETVNDYIPPVTFETNILSDNTVVITAVTNPGTWRPNPSSDWGYDAPREFQDLPSSLHHLSNLRVPPPLFFLPMIRPSYGGNPYHEGGDTRLGEVTSPYDSSIYGTDVGFAPSVVNPEDFRFNSDGVITPAGPWARCIHGNGKYDAGNVLNLEVATWRLDGQSLTGPKAGHAGNALDLIMYSGDHRDVDLNGLISQGETVPEGAHAYFVDDMTTTDDGGLTSDGSFYPFNWDRYAEDCIEVWDLSEDYGALLRNNVNADDIETILANVPTAPLQSGAVGTPINNVLMYSNGDAVHTNMTVGDYAWIDANGNGAYDGDFLLNDVSGVTYGDTADDQITNAVYRDTDGSGSFSDGDDAWDDVNGNGRFDSEVVLADNMYGGTRLKNGDVGKPINYWVAAVQAVFRNNDGSTNGLGQPTYTYGDDVWIENRWPTYTNGMVMAYDANSNDLELIVSSILTNGAPADGVLSNVYYYHRSAAWDTGFEREEDDIWIDGNGNGTFDAEEILYRVRQFAYNAVFTPNWLTNQTPGVAFANQVWGQWNNAGTVYEEGVDDAWVEYALPNAQYSLEQLISPSPWVNNHGVWNFAPPTLDPGTIAHAPVSGVVFEDRDADGVLDVGSEPVFIDVNGNGWYDGNRGQLPIYFVGWNDGVNPWKPSPAGSRFDVVTEDHIRIPSSFLSVETWHDSIVVLCHEQGHEIHGWPDLYDYDISAVGVYNQPIGGFDLMAVGGLVHGVPNLKESGYTTAPQPWVTPNLMENILVVDGGMHTILMYPVDNQANRNQYFRLQNPDGTLEYYYFWYQADPDISRWAGAGSTGFHIEHDDYTAWPDPAVPPQQRYNPHPTWGMVQADGLNEMDDGLNSGGNDDVWPGTTGNRTFTPFTDPEARWWSQEDAGFRVLDVRLPPAGETWGPIEVDFMYIDTDLPWSWPTGGSDADGDGMPDVWEYHWFGNLTWAGGGTDYDGDGLSDLGEYLTQGNPFDDKYSQDPNDLELDSDYDTDGDGISNADEVEIWGSNPTDPDTDDDGWLDGREVNFSLYCPDTPPLAYANGVLRQRKLTSPVYSRSPLVQRCAELSGRNYRYAYVPGSFTWQEAALDAMRRGGQLATVYDAAENSMITNILAQAGVGFAWIGASDAASEGNFTWIDGTPVGGVALPYSNWGEGVPLGVNAQPDDYGTGQDYAAISTVFVPNFGQAGQWYDFGATTEMGYVIELGGAIGVPNVQIPTENRLALTNWTIECWVNLATTNETGHFIRRITSTFETNYELRVDMGAPSVKFTTEGGQLYQVVASNSLESNTWVHLAGVWSTDNNSLKLYVDGVLYDTTDCIEDCAVGSILPEYGGYACGNVTLGGGIVGYLDEVRIWGEHRTPNEIAQGMTWFGGGMVSTVGGPENVIPVTNTAVGPTGGAVVNELHGTSVLGQAFYSGTLSNLTVVPGSLVIQIGICPMADNGQGNLTCIAGCTGTINYNTGAWALDMTTVMNDAANFAGQQLLASYNWTNAAAGGIGGGVTRGNLIAWFPFDDGGITAEDYIHLLDWNYALMGVAFTTNTFADLEGMWDQDDDEIPDWWELMWFGESCEPNEDSDGDGLTNLDEYLIDTNPTDGDTDGDGIVDPDEDDDGDGVSNGDEVNTHGTDPQDPDTDDDGWTDGQEINSYIVCPTNGPGRHVTSPLDSRSPLIQRSMCMTGTVTEVPGRVGLGAEDRFDLGTWTLECWYMATNSGQTGSIIARTTIAGETNFALRLINDYPTIEYTTEASIRYYVQALAPLEVGKWTHLAGVFDPDNNTLALYVDAHDYQAQWTIEPCSRGNGTTVLGKGVTGYLDELRIWGVARSKDEVLTWMPRVLNAFTKGAVAVVPSNIDPVHLRLQEMGIEYTAITEQDLYNAKTWEMYTAIFLPCLIDETPAYDPDVQQMMRDYVENGGNLYVACWAGDYVDEPWPEVGSLIDGPVFDATATILDPEVAAYVGSDTMEITHGYDNIESFNASEINQILYSYETNWLGEEIGLIAFSFTRGSGKVVYTAYHSESPAEENPEQAKFLEWVVKEVTSTPGVPVGYYVFDDGGLTAECYSHRLDWGFALDASTFAFSSNVYADLLGIFDDDVDGLPNWWEDFVYGGDADPDEDTDADGLSNIEEYIVDTNPLDVDSDGDGLSDDWEDYDNDGVTNEDEFDKYGTDPTDADSDDDGMGDATEIAALTSPIHSMCEDPAARRSLDLTTAGIPTTGIVLPMIDRFDTTPKAAVSTADGGGTGGTGVVGDDETQEGDDTIAGWSVEAWFRSANAAAQTGEIISHKVWGQSQYEIGVSNGVPYALFHTRLGVQYAVTDLVAVPNDTWTHIAAVWDPIARNLTLYVNGTRGFRTAVPLDTVPVAGAGQARIGVSAGGWTSAWVDEVRVWGRYRSQEEIGRYGRKLAGADMAELIACYRFDDGGSAIEDFAHPSPSTEWTRYLIDSADYGVNITGNTADWVTTAQFVDMLGADDTDADGLPDWWESFYGLDILSADGDTNDTLDVDEDMDQDGLNNLYEYLCGTRPDEAKTDGATLDAERDTPDADGLLNMYEQAYGADPRYADTDEDGVTDLAEVEGVPAQAYEDWPYSDPANPTDPIVRRGVVIGGAGRVLVPAQTDQAKYAVGEWTVEAWVRPDAGSDGGIVLRRAVENIGAVGEVLNYELGLVNVGGTLRPYVLFGPRNAPAIAYSPSAAVPADGSNWTHIAGTYVGSPATLTLYMGGMPVASLNSDELVGREMPVFGADVAEVTIGDDNVIGGAYAFEGAIDEVRVWSLANDAATVWDQHRTIIVRAVVQEEDDDDGGGGGGGGGGTAVITPTVDVEELLAAFMGENNLPPGVSDMTATYIGQGASAIASGTYIGFPELPNSAQMLDGIIISCGKASDAAGPNASGSTTTVLGTPGDADLAAIADMDVSQSFDAIGITLQFTTDATVDGLSFDMVFGSEEFPEYVGTSFNDAFGAFLDGMNITFDDNGNPLTVNNNFFELDNDPWDPGDPDSIGKTPVDVDMEWDGLTPVLRTSWTLAPGSHTLKFVICDFGDQILDSGIYLANLNFVGDVVTAQKGRLIAYFRFDDDGTEAQDFAETDMRWGIDVSAAVTEGTAAVSGGLGDYAELLGDSDEDGIPDWWEVAYGLDRNNVEDGLEDPDADALNNLNEYLAGTHPMRPDIDFDAVTDDVDDSDADGTQNYDEQVLGSSPGAWLFPELADTDDDGVTDAGEIAAATMPGQSLSPWVSRALQLGGTAGDYMLLPAQPRFKLSDGWTVEAWIKLDPADGDGGIILARNVTTDDGTASVNYELGVDNTRRLYARYVDGSGAERRLTADSPISTLADKWRHVAATWDAETDEFILYINGDVEDSTVGGGSKPGLVDVGSIQTVVGQGIMGRIEEVRIWDYAMQLIDIALASGIPLAGTEEGLVAYYRFDDGGIAAEDSVASSGRDWLTHWFNAGAMVGNASLVTITDSPIAGNGQDSDDDDLPDWWETQFFGDLESTSGGSDSDGDGLTDYYEFLAGLNPLSIISYADGVEDGQRDSDGDGLNDLFEFGQGTLPNKVDTDDDGLTDREEVAGVDDAVLTPGLAPLRVSNPLRSTDPPKARSLLFAGDGRVVVPPQDRHSLLDWTIEAWVSASNGCDGVIVSRAVRDLESGVQGINYEIGIEDDAGTLRPYVRYVSTTNQQPYEVKVNGTGATEVYGGALADVVVTPGIWTHIAGTFDSETHRLSLYIDGALASYRNDAIELPAIGASPGIEIGSELTIGGGALMGGVVQNGFEGYIDDVRIVYDTATEEEIQADMAGPTVAIKTLLSYSRPSSGGLPPLSVEEAMSHDHVTDELLVKFKDNVRITEQTTIIEQLGARQTGKYAFAGVSRLEIADGGTLAEKLEAFRADDNVLYAEPNYILQADKTPNDSMFDQLWGMHNTGQENGTEDADIDAPEAWGKSTGSKSIIVAVIDTGVDYEHEDLAANMWINDGETPGNGEDDDGNGYVDDVYGYDFFDNDGDPMDSTGEHGTHCAGTIGGVGNNSVGVAGVNWQVKIMALRFIGPFGGPTDAAIEAVQYAVKMNAKLTSNSWGGGGYSQALYDAINAAKNANQLFVAAAGNDGMDTDVTPHYPSSYDLENIISVAATDRNDLLASFSNYGTNTVDLSAPGVEILSTVPGNGYDRFQGTSMACPHVAGAAAWIYSMNPNLGWEAVKELILEGVDQIPSLEGRVLTGGRLNLNNIDVTPGVPGIPGASGLLVGYFSCDDMGVTLEDFTVAEDWRDDWSHAGRILNAQFSTNIMMDIAADSDEDGMPDWWEVAMGFDPLSDKELPDADEDGDGLVNYYEYLAGTDPMRVDTDRDGTTDDAEDSDGDGLSNVDEQNRRTDPGDVDTDDDGLNDKEEVDQATDPLVSIDPYVMRYIHNEGQGWIAIKDDAAGKDPFGSRFNLNTWTIEAGVRLTAMPTNRVILLRRMAHGNMTTFELGVDTNLLAYVRFETDAGAPYEVQGSEPLVLNEWTYLSGRFGLVQSPADGELTLFQNCVPVARDTTTATPALGRQVGDLIVGLNLIGDIDEVRVWSLDLSDAEIRSRCGKTLNFGQDVARMGSLDTRNGGWMQRNSGGDDPTKLEDAWTIEAWVKADTPGIIVAREAGVAEDNETLYNYNMRITADGMIEAIMDVYDLLLIQTGDNINPLWRWGTITLGGRVSMTDGSWHHVAIVFDSQGGANGVGQFQLIADGRMQDSVDFYLPVTDIQWHLLPGETVVDYWWPWLPPPPGGPGPQHLRATAGGPFLVAQGLRGLTDEVRVYNLPYTIQEINARRYTKATGAGLVTYFDYDDVELDWTRMVPDAAARDDESREGELIDEATIAAGAGDNAPIEVSPLEVLIYKLPLYLAMDDGRGPGNMNVVEDFSQMGDRDYAGSLMPSTSEIDFALYTTDNMFDPGNPYVGYDPAMTFPSPVFVPMTNNCPWRLESDGDRMPDVFEVYFNLDPNRIFSPEDRELQWDGDKDGDGLINLFEYYAASDPTFADSDGDKIDDIDEDPDGDGLSNGEEQDLGTHPMRVDSDDDGFTDGEEAIGQLGRYPFASNPANSMDPKAYFELTQPDIRRNFKSMVLDGNAYEIPRPIGDKRRFNAENWTVECWVRPTNAGATGPLVQYVGTIYDGAPRTLTFYEIGLTNGVPYVKFDATDTFSVPDVTFGPVIADQWTHIAGVFSATDKTLTLYRDGIKAAGLQVFQRPMSGTETGDLYPGKAYVGGPGVLGSIDDVRIWSLARAQQQVIDGMSSVVQLDEEGQICHFRFDDGRRSTAPGVEVPDGYGLNDGQGAEDFAHRPDGLDLDAPWDYALRDITFDYNNAAPVSSYTFDDEDRDGLADWWEGPRLAETLTYWTPVKESSGYVADSVRVDERRRGYEAPAFSCVYFGWSIDYTPMLTLPDHRWYEEPDSAWMFKDIELPEGYRTVEIKMAIEDGQTDLYINGAGVEWADITTYTASNTFDFDIVISDNTLELHIPYEAISNYFVVGRNRIAVEMRNIDGVLSDEYFSMEVIVDGEDYVVRRGDDEELEDRALARWFVYGMQGTMSPPPPDMNGRLWWEKDYALDNLQDLDEDGIDAVNEFVLGLNPFEVDTDGNGVLDTNEDPDGDGVANIDELDVHFTNPLDPDSDDDGFSDGDEVANDVACGGVPITSPTYSRTPLRQRSLVLTGAESLVVPEGTGTDRNRFALKTWTVECFVWPNGGQTGALIQRTTAVGENTFSLRLDANVPAVRYTTEGGNVVTLSGGAAPGGTWTHIAGILDMEKLELRLMVDGVQVGIVDDIEPPARGLGVTTLGEVGGFVGAIDELRIWDQARLTNEVSASQWIITDSERPVAWYPFDDGENMIVANAINGLVLGHGAEDYMHLLDWDYAIRGATFTVAVFADVLTTMVDADSDGLPDAWELQYSLDTTEPLGDNGTEGDPDGDGIRNIEEFLAGSNPKAAFLRSVPAAVLDIQVGDIVPVTLIRSLGVSNTAMTVWLWSSDNTMFTVDTPVITFASGEDTATALIRGVAQSLGQQGSHRGILTVTTDEGALGLSLAVNVYNGEDLEIVTTTNTVVAGDTTTLTVRRTRRTDIGLLEMPLLVTLISGNPDLLAVPDAVIIPGGVDEIGFPVSGVAPGTNVMVYGMATGYPLATNMMDVLPPTLSITPSVVNLTAGDTAQLMLTRLPNEIGADLVVDLSSDVPGVFTPDVAQITIPATVLGVVFNITTFAGGNGRLIAEVGSYATSADVNVASNALELTTGLTVIAGDSRLMSVRRQPVGAEDMVVTVVSSDPNTLDTATNQVVIAAGEESATFEILGVQPGVANVIASGAGFINGTEPVTVLDPNLSWDSAAYSVELDGEATAVLQRPASQAGGTLEVVLASSSNQIFTVTALATFQPGVSSLNITLGGGSDTNEIGNSAILSSSVGSYVGPNATVTLVERTFRLESIDWYDVDSDRSYSEDDRVVLFFNDTAMTNTVIPTNLVVMRDLGAGVWSPAPANWGFGATVTVSNDVAYPPNSIFIVTLGATPTLSASVNPADSAPWGVDPSSNVTDIATNADNTAPPVLLPQYAFGTDGDGDGLPTQWEIDNNLDPMNPNGIHGAWGDPDADGLNNRGEWLAGTDPWNPDSDGDSYNDYDSPATAGQRNYGELYTDGDGIPDAWEILYPGPCPDTGKRGLDPVYYDAHLDPDEDGWSNYAEYMCKRPNEDGVLVQSSNPIDPDDYPEPEMQIRVRYHGLLGDTIDDALAVSGAPIILEFYDVATMDGFPKGTLEMTTGITNTRVMTTGHVVENTNYVWGFIDIDGSGAWEVGEPGGLADPQPLMGWDDVNNIEIGLKDDHLAKPLWRFAWEDVGAPSYMVEIVTGTVTNFRREVVGRNYMHEGDYLSVGTFGITDSTNAPVALISTNHPLVGWLIYDSVLKLESTVTLTQPSIVTPHDYSPYAYARNEYEWIMHDDASSYTLDIATSSNAASIIMSVTNVAPFMDVDGVRKAMLPFFAGDQRPDGGIWSNGRYFARVTASTGGSGATNMSAPSAWSAFLLNVEVPEDGGKSAVDGELTYFGKVTEAYPGTSDPGNNNTAGDELPIIVQAYQSAGFSGVPDAQIQVNYECTGLAEPNKGPYELLGLRNEVYYIRAFIDVNGNRRLDYWEPWGFAKEGVESSDYEPDAIDLTGVGSIRWSNVRIVIRDRDTDDDDLPDGWEWMWFGSLNPGAYDDSDGDGLDNITEYMADPLDSSPIYADTDGDGLDDGYEYENGLSAVRSDTDGDGLDDGFEVGSGFDPLDPNGDKDGDGVSDAYEILVIRTDPNDPNDYLKVGNITMDGFGNVTVKWDGKSNVNYKIQYTTNLTDWLDIVGSDRTGDGSLEYSGECPADGSVFYRVVGW